MVACCKCEHDLHPFTVETAPALTASLRRIAFCRQKKRIAHSPLTIRQAFSSLNAFSLRSLDGGFRVAVQAAPGKGIVKKKKKKGKTRLPAGESSATCRARHDGTAKKRFSAPAPILTRPTWQQAFGHNGTAKVLGGSNAASNFRTERPLEWPSIWPKRGTPTCDQNVKFIYASQLFKQKRA